MSAQGVLAGALSNGFKRVEEDGEEYLVHDVVAQKEGVYYYPDPQGGVMREFVPAEELIDASEETNEEPVLIKHPEAPEGTPKLTTNPRANYTEVGSWRDIGPTDDEEGVGGRVFIRLNEVGEHDGLLRKYLKQINQFGFGEVSTGYDIQEAVPETGRHNGREYDATQRGHRFDHLALLPEEQGDCSIEDGCGLGRANQDEQTFARVNHHIPGSDDARMQTPAGERAEVPDETDPFRWIGRQVASIFGWGQSDEGETMSAETDRSNASASVHEPDYSGETETEWSKPDFEDFKEPYNLSDDDSFGDLDSEMRSAIAEHFLVSMSGFPPDSFGDLKLPVVEPDGQLNLNGVESAMQMDSQVDGISDEQLSRVESILEDLLPEDRLNKMEDQEKIDELVQTYGLDRENVAHLAGEDCLDRIYSQFSEKSEPGNNMGDDNNGDEGGDEALTEEQREEITQIVEESAPSADEIADQIEFPSFDGEEVDIDEDEIVENAADKAAEKAEQARAHKQNVELIAESEELSHIDRERAERMNEDLAEELAEDLQSEDDDSSRANQAGRPSGDSFDPSEFASDDSELSDLSSGAPRLGEGDD